MSDPEVLRFGLQEAIREEIKHRRPDLRPVFFPDGPARVIDGHVSVLATLPVIRDSETDSRYCWQEFRVELGRLRETLDVEVRAGVKSLLALYDKEVAEGPFPLEEATA